MLKDPTKQIDLEKYQLLSKATEVKILLNFKELKVCENFRFSAISTNQPTFSTVGLQ